MLHRGLSTTTKNVINSSISKATFSKTTSSQSQQHARRTFSSSSNMPPSYKDQIKKGVPFGKRKLYGKEMHMAFQISWGVSLFIAFIATPFLGKKLAKDPDFRKFFPEWYYEKYRVEYPEHSNTRQSLHDQLVEMQQDLRQRAINGEFTDEKLKKMTFLENQNEHEESDPHGFGKIHPGVDDDDEDDDE